MRSENALSEKDCVGHRTLASSRTAYEAWHLQLGTESDSHEPWHQLVKKHLDTDVDLLGKRILEIGCGRGGFACWLSRQARPPSSVVAADFSSTAVQKGRFFATERGIKVKWEIMDIQCIAHPDCSFDTVISCETVEHVADPFKAVRELARVLRPGGRL